MSGGSYDYAYLKVNDFVGNLRSVHNSPLRKAFADHLELVAKAMHDIEWVDSGDYGKGDEEESIRKCISKDSELKAAISMAESVMKLLENTIKSAKI